LNPFKPVLLAGGVFGLAALTAWVANERPMSFQVSDTPYELISERADQGDAEAQLAMGHRYSQGDGVIKNDKEALANRSGSGTMIRE
jgi:hypothetical protein